MAPGSTFALGASNLGAPGLRQSQGDCDAPNSAPDGVLSEGVTLRDCVELGLFNLYLPFSQIKKKKHLHLHYKYHRSGIHVLYTESPYFSIYKTYTYSKNTEIAEAVR